MDSRRARKKNLIQSSKQRRVAIGSNADHLDGHAHELFQRLDVLLRFLGKLLKASAAADVAVPALKRLVDWLDSGKDIDIGAKIVQSLALIAIAGAYLDAIEA